MSLSCCRSCSEWMHAELVEQSSARQASWVSRVFSASGQLQQECVWTVTPFSSLSSGIVRDWLRPHISHIHVHLCPHDSLPRTHSYLSPYSKKKQKKNKTFEQFIRRHTNNNLPSKPAQHNTYTKLLTQRLIEKQCKTIIQLVTVNESNPHDLLKFKTIYNSANNEKTKYHEVQSHKFINTKLRFGFSRALFTSWKHHVKKLFQEFLRLVQTLEIFHTLEFPSNWTITSLLMIQMYSEVWVCGATSGGDFKWRANKRKWGLMITFWLVDDGNLTSCLSCWSLITVTALRK